MSGGSMDYLYYKVEDAQFRDITVLRRAFRKHLAKVAAALKAIEWNDSGDGDPDEETLIRACLTPECEIAQAKEELENAMQTADEMMKIFGYEREKACQTK